MNIKCKIKYTTTSVLLDYAALGCTWAIGLFAWFSQQRLESRLRVTEVLSDPLQVTGSENQIEYLGYICGVTFSFGGRGTGHRTFHMKVKKKKKKKKTFRLWYNTITSVLLSGESVSNIRRFSSSKSNKHDGLHSQQLWMFRGVCS